MNGFGDLLRKYRQRSRDPRQGIPLTQARLAELLSLNLAIEGYSGATVSNWERGKNQIRRDDRLVLISLLKSLRDCGGIHTAEEANEILAAGNYRPLDDTELPQVNPAWKRGQPPKTGETVLLSTEEQEGLLPSPAYSHLFGLEMAKELLLPLFLSPKSPHLVMIVGLGGLGKTALADALARQAIHTGHFERVIWLSTETVREEFQSHQATTSIWRSVVDALGHQLLADRPLDPNWSRRQLQIRSVLKRQRFLVVIDNLEDRAETNWLLNQLHGLVDPSKFLLTARHHPAPESEAFVFPLSQLPQAEAVALLRYQAHLGGVNAFEQMTDEAMGIVYQTIGGHPQALRLVAHLARMYPLMDILSGWTEGQAGYIAHMYQSIYESLWQQLVPDERQLLEGMRLVAQVGATTNQLQFVSGLTRQQFWPALTKLIELCLIEPRGSIQQQRYGIHSLTAHFLYSLGESGAVHDIFFSERILAAIDYWDNYLGHLPEKQWPTFEIELPNLFQAIRFSLILTEEAMTSTLRESWLTIAERLFPFMEQRGFVTEWIPLLEKTIAQFAHDPRPQTQLLNQLGKLYRLSQQLPQAIAIHHQVEQIAQKLEDEAEVAQASLNLGTDYYRGRDYQSAERYAQNALALFSRLAPSGRGTAATLNLLGNIARAQNDLASSVGYLQEAISIWKTLDLVPELARTFNNLALTWQQQEKVDLARQCYQEAKAVLTKTASELDRILIHLSEGTLYFTLARYDEAEVSFGRIDRAFLQKSGHRLYQALTLNNLGNVAFMRQDFDQARNWLTESATVWRQIADELELANTLSRLGDTYMAQNNGTKAELCFQEVLSLARRFPTDARACQLAEDAQEQLQKVTQQKKEANQYAG